MTDAQRQRLFDIREAFDHPVTVGLTVVVVAMLAVTPAVIGLLDRRGKLTPAHRKELLDRYKSWLVLAPLIVVPVLAGAFWTILAVCVLSLLCYREYARATGLFREKLLSLVVVLAILLIHFAVLDHWYRLFVALSPLGVAAIAAFTIFTDRPKGYIQRVGLGVLGFMLLGVCLGHAGYFANDRDYRPMLLMLVAAVELNDVFAYVVGKSVGGPKLAPNTSPNKTIAGSAGALVLTTSLVVLLGWFVFRGPKSLHIGHLIVLGLMISALGQLGDLLLSSVKRDVGIKDMGALFPGHGGLLDRFNSLILAAPAMFHYVNYFVGVGADETPNVFTR